MKLSTRPVAFITVLAAAVIGGGAFAATSIQLVSADDPETGSVFTTVEQCRLVDTRPASNVGPQSGPLGAGETVTFTAHGTNGECTIPTEATALALNVTAVGATEQTFLTIWDGGENPGTSSLNPAPGQPPTPNGVNTPLSDTGTFDVFNNVGSVNAIIDVVGFYGPHDHDDVYLRITDAETEYLSVADAQTDYVPQSAVAGDGVFVSGVVTDDTGSAPSISSTAPTGISAAVAVGVDDDGEYEVTVSGLPDGFEPRVLLTAIEDASPGTGDAGRSCVLGAAALTVTGGSLTIPVGCFGEDDAGTDAIVSEDSSFHFLLIG